MDPTSPLAVSNSSLADRQNTVLFTESDLALFSEASGDRNPLHLNQQYAQGTPYGERVAFGCLGALASLGRLQVPPGRSPTSLEAEFLRPMFLGVSYRCEAVQKGKLRAVLSDGTVPVLSVSLTTAPSKTDPPEPAGVPAASKRQTPAVWRLEQIAPGVQIRGEYNWDPTALAALIAKWGPVDGSLAVALLWSSYLIGMELPGESALFAKLALRIHEPGIWPAALHYRASVASVDERFGYVTLNISLLAGESVLASGTASAYVRPPIPEDVPAESLGSKPDSMSGRVAVLIGASRGLGAAIRRALELRGVAVYGISRSDSRGEPSQIEQGDGADPEALRRLRDRICRERGRLDYLICNACPPILPLRLEPTSTDRVGAYIGRAVSLALAPLTEFLDLLNSHGGCAVMISSAAVDKPERDWPHYVAAKRAIEALGWVAPLQYPCVCTIIVRPPKLLTTLTNTPAGRIGAIPPGPLASRIAARLERPPEPGETVILE